MINEEKMDVVACFDKGFVMPTSVMMYSVCVNNQDVEVVFHLVIDESVVEEDKNNIVKTISDFPRMKCVFYLVSSKLTASFPLYNGLHITRSAYYRLFLSDILPATLDKVLYLDGDLIIRHSLLSLWETDLTEYAIGASIDWAEGRDEIYSRLGYSPQKGCINTGVMLINLSYWRKYKLVKLFVDYLTEYSDKVIFVDQDVLNVVLQDQKYLIPVKYNLQTGFLRTVSEWDRKKYVKEVEEAIEDPIIVHFTEKCKPWCAYVHYPHPYRSTFYKYQNQTRWKGAKVWHGMLKQMVRGYMADFLMLIKIVKPIKSPFLNVKPID